ncbi:unnamed protein product [Amoebophrya sp. A25]|nr:unnamed protein product [Amoebophrya sp. A25]|eukprot:GSA25T00025931001.1
MEVLFYVIANGCFLLAGIMLLFEKHRMAEKSDQWSKPQEVMVARDTQIMFFIGTLLRFYWSASPPAVWSNESDLVKILCKLDITMSPIVWGAVCWHVARNQVKYTQSLRIGLGSGQSIPLNWAALTVITYFFSMVLHYLNPPVKSWTGDIHNEPWPMADVSVVWNMTLDCVAMFPQLYVIYKTDEPVSDGAANFVGTLCVSRVLRMFAWGHIIYTAWVRAVEVPAFLWCYVLPDTLHTVLMGNYLVLFLQKLKNTVVAWGNAAEEIV